MAFGRGFGVVSGSGSGFCRGLGVAASGVGVGWAGFGLGLGFEELSGDGVIGSVFISSRALRNWSLFSSSVVWPNRTLIGSIQRAIKRRKRGRTRRMVTNHPTNSSGATPKIANLRIEASHR
jgi:hypothetical protein